MAALRKTVFIAQWILPPFFVIWWSFAPGVGKGGWWIVGMLIVAPMILIVLYVPAIFSVCVGGNRRARTVHPAYAVAMLVLWILGLIPPMAIQGDSGISISPSMLERIGMPESVATGISFTALALAGCAWIVALIFAFVTARHGVADMGDADPVADELGAGSQ